MAKEDRILILPEAKFIWSREEIERAISLFSEGYKPSQVAVMMNQKYIDVGILYLHLIDQRKVR